MKHELIGRKVKIELTGKKIFYGEIIDETKNMICLMAGKKIKKFIKKTIKIHIGNEVISGTDILKRPEERIKACKPLKRKDSIIKK